ncbi:hypothetical protein NOCA180200 [metagenome]|uniref:Uncharacterized protein n=1 Tax=metagenome TaxID=256318 RepID=A0A2P2CKT1_9ZZZZ
MLPQLLWGCVINELGMLTAIPPAEYRSGVLRWASPQCALAGLAANAVSTPQKTVANAPPVTRFMRILTPFLVREALVGLIHSSGTLPIPRRRVGYLKDESCRWRSDGWPEHHASSR